MALYYYISLNLSRINIKKKSPWGEIKRREKRYIYIPIYRENTTNHLGERRKEKRYSPIYIGKILLDKLYILYSYIYKKNTQSPLGGKEKEKRDILVIKDKYIIVYLYFPYRKIYISNIKQE